MIIENSRFENLKSDHTGGAISVGAKFGEETSVNLTIRDSRFVNNRTYFWRPDTKTTSNPQNTNAGGSIYVSNGATVNIESSNFDTDADIGGNIHAFEGGYIYNAGHTTIGLGTVINGGSALRTGGTIFNDGYLKLDEVTINDKWRAHFVGGAWWGGNPHPTKGNEYAGINIYARKDVIITPNADITTAGDVHVINGQSAVILTGPLTRRLDVSISEADRDDPSLPENAHRHIGYTVAKSDGTYKINSTDAKFINYITKDTSQEVSEYNNHTSLGKWDYVLNPIDNTVVLGQRVKMVYHTNDAEATIEDGVDDDSTAGKKLDQIYTIFKSGKGKAKVSVDNEHVEELTPTDKVPELQNYFFRSWNKDTVLGKARYDLNKLEDIYDFTSNENTFTRGSEEEITDLINPHTLNAYAVYDKKLIIKAKKVWNAKNKENVTLQLVRTDKNNQVIEEIEVSKDSSEWVQFSAVPKIEDGVEIVANYKVVEKNSQDGKINLAGKKYSVVIEDVTDTTTIQDDPNKDSYTKYFKVTNSELMSFKVKKSWRATNKIDTSFALKRTDNENNEQVVNIQSTNSEWVSFNDVSIFVDGVDVSNKYEVVELNATDKIVNGNTFKILNSNGYKFVVSKEDVTDNSQEVGNKEENTKYFKFTNTQVKDLIVNKVWNLKSRNIQTSNVNVQLYKTVNNNQEVEGTSISLGRTHKFENLPVVNDEGREIVYSVKELNDSNKAIEEDGNIVIGQNDYTVNYTKEDDSFTITNTIADEKFVIKARKTWNAQIKDDVTLQLIRSDSKEVIEEKIVQSNSSEWVTFKELLRYENGVDTLSKYEIKEKGVNSDNIVMLNNGKKYLVSYTDDTAEITNATKENNVKYFTVKNTELFDITVRKTWANDDTSHTENISVSLFDGDKKVGDSINLIHDDNYESKFENIVKLNEQGVAIDYSVKEDGVAEDSTIFIGGRKYRVSVEKDDDGNFEITNTLITVNIRGIKIWENDEGKTRPESITLNLIKGENVVESVKVRKGNDDSWSWTFGNKSMYEDGNEVLYSIKEVGEVDSRIVIGNNIYSVSVEGTIADGFTVTNTYVPKVTPLVPAKTKLTVIKQWQDVNHVEEEVKIQLYKNGEVLGDAKVLNKDNNWMHTFDDLLVVDNLDAKPNVYSVKEVGEEEGIIKINNNSYEVSYKREGSKVLVINNYINDGDEMPPEPIQPEPVPNPIPDPTPEPTPQPNSEDVGMDTLPSTGVHSNLFDSAILLSSLLALCIIIAKTISKTRSKK